MNLLITVGAMILLLAPLIAIHEFGHFWVARRFGIKVLTFSIGFGPVLFKRTARDGVTYQLAAIPFGGYVRMADEREGEVNPEDLPHAFNRQSPWVKLAVVAAGPLVNLVTAFILCWILLLPRHDVMNTRVGDVLPSSPAAVAGIKPGELLTHVDGKPVETLEQLHLALLDRMGDSGSIRLTGVSAAGQTAEHALQVKDFMRHAGQEPLTSLGLLPWTPKLPPVVGSLEPGGPAEKQGLHVGDKIVAINGKPVQQWQDIAPLIDPLADRFVTLDLLRNNQPVQLKAMLGSRQDPQQKERGYLGVGVKIPENLKRPADYTRELRYGPIEAIPVAWQKTVNLSRMTLDAVGKLLTGHISVDNISGPISIAQVAGSSVMIGLAAFLQTMAFLSVSLGIMNLLPVPVLDGGHIVYYAVEGITRRPVPQRVQEYGLKLGMALLLGVMVLAIGNDLLRVFGG